MEITINKLKNSEIEIIGSISFNDLEKYRILAIKKISENITIDGFRKGHIPEKVLIEKLGEMTLLQEMGEMALQEKYPSIILENKIDAIGSPQVAITKLAPNNPMEFKIIQAVMPAIILPDYKEIAKKEMTKKDDPILVTEEEMESTIKQILKSENNHSEHQHNEKGECEEKEPELTDELVKNFGDFKTVDEFKTKLKENIQAEKEFRAKEKKKISILEEIIKKIKIELPEILIEAELRKMLAEMNDNIGRMGLNFEKYLEHIKKTEDDLKKEWRSDAEKRALIQMVLNQIALEEKINPKEEDVEKAVSALMEQHKNARKENVEIYVRMMLTNEEVFKLLESTN